MEDSLDGRGALEALLSQHQNAKPFPQAWTTLAELNARYREKHDFARIFSPQGLSPSSPFWQSCAEEQWDLPAARHTHCQGRAPLQGFMCACGKHCACLTSVTQNPTQE